MGETPRGSGPLVAPVDAAADLATVLDGAGVPRRRPVVVLVGGAGGMPDELVAALQDVLRRAVLPVVGSRDAVVVDGGTRSGVMQAVGRARAAAGATFPLVGVAVEATVALPGGPAAPTVDDAAEPDPRHTHLLLVPGSGWGDEAPWIARVADAVAGGRPSVTILVNGGEIAFDDALASLARGRPVVVLAGTGRTADVIADAAAGGSGDDRSRHIAGSALTRIVPLDDPDALAAALAAALRDGAR